MTTAGIAAALPGIAVRAAALPPLPGWQGSACWRAVTYSETAGIGSRCLELGHDLGGLVES